MNKTSLLAKLMVIAAIFTCSLKAQAEVYRWEDEDGRVHYGDRPQGNKATEVDIKNEPTKPTNPDDWQSIKQRQQRYLEYLEDERKERDEVKEKLAEEKAERKKLCEEATDYHRELLTTPMWYREDEDGNKTYLDHKEKDEEIRKTKELMDKYCRK